MGANREQLLNLWQQKGKSILEFASPVFFSRLSVEQSKEIEDCQRKAFAIIFQMDYYSYSRALDMLGQEKLSVRRTASAIKFGEKCVVNPKHTDMLPRSLPGRQDLRHQRLPYQEYLCRTDILNDSSLPAIARLLNEKYKVE